MGASLSVQGFADVENPEYQKHYKAVSFCVENGLSLPKETSDFFKGKVGMDDLEDIRKESWVDAVNHGLSVELPLTKIDNWGLVKEIKVSDIPKEVDRIIISIEY